MPPKDPKSIDYVEKVMLRASELRPGMYVCDLDRPWLETPFLLQGFEITCEADVEAVMQHCEHVFIDMQRSRIVKQAPRKPSGPAAPGEVGKKDLKASAAAHKQASGLLKSFADEIRFGHTPKLHLVKGAVSECVAGVVSHPSAMLLMAKLREKDEYTSQHAFNVCVYAIIIGRILGYDNQQLENLGACGLLHDMGKLEIPAEVLNKPGKLTDEETAIMQTHAIRGRDILMSGRDIFSGAVDVAYGHHEHLDGTGYPRGLQGHQLNTNCRIVAVVDKYDALTTHRPYRPGRDHLSAVAVLNSLTKENKIDGDLKAAFISYLGVYPPGTIVELNSGEIGIVLGSKPENRLRPQVFIVRDADRQPAQLFVDMSEKTTDQHGKPYRVKAVRTAGDFGIDVSQYYELIVEAMG